MRIGGNPQRGFTIVEMVVVMVIVGILASVALPRFLNLQEDAHDAQGQQLSGSIGSAVHLVHGKWLAQSGGATVTLEGGVAVDTNASGWPSEPSGSPMSQSGCLDLWQRLLSSAPPAAVGYSPGTDGWGALAGGSLCGWIYEPDTTPIRVIIYDTSNGRVWTINL